MNRLLLRKHRAATVIVAAVMALFGDMACAGTGWKAGTARQAITPKEPLWMAGYGARNKPSEGAVHDLWAKALALQDPAGNRVLLVTLDLCGIDRALSDRIRAPLARGTALGATRSYSRAHTRTPVLWLGRT